jgi:hypothetical protein
MCVSYQQSNPDEVHCGREAKGRRRILHALPILTFTSGTVGLTLSTTHTSPPTPHPFATFQEAYEKVDKNHDRIKESRKRIIG